MAEERAWDEQSSRKTIPERLDSSSQAVLLDDLLNRQSSSTSDGMTDVGVSVRPVSCCTRGTLVDCVDDLPTDEHGSDGNVSGSETFRTGEDVRLKKIRGRERVGSRLVRIKKKKRGRKRASSIFGTQRKKGEQGRVGNGMKDTP